MAIELPINLIYKNKNTPGATGGGTGGESKGREKTNKKLGGISGILRKILPLLAVISSAVAVIKPLFDILSAFFAIISSIVLNQLEPLIKGLVGFSKELSKILSGDITLEDFVKNTFDVILTTIKDVAIARFKEVVDFFKLVFTVVWEVVKRSFDVFKSVGVFIWENIIKPVWETLASWFSTIWTNYIQPVWESLKSSFSTIWNDIIKPVWENLRGFFESIWDDFIKPAWDFVAEKIEGAWNILKSAFDFVASKIKSFLSKLNPFGGRGDGGDGARAFGGVIPKDGLYRMHAGEQVSRGNTSNMSSGGKSTNLTINVSGGMDNKTIDKLTRELDRTLSIYGRW